MRQNYFFEYVPNAYINLCVDMAGQRANNRFVYDFKAGDKMATELCAGWLVSYLTSQYGYMLKDIIVVFAPCSNQAKYNKRFGYLAHLLNTSGISTANEHVHIYGERKPLHNGGSHYVSEQLYHVSVDGDFKGKTVILFDDLLTSGRTIEEFRAKVEAAGAYVEREIFLARTVHHDPVSRRGILQEMAEGFYEQAARSKRCFPQGVNINKQSNNNLNKVA